LARTHRYAESLMNCRSVSRRHNLGTELTPRTFEKIAWVFPKELGNYDFLAANRELIAQLATGRIKARRTSRAHKKPARAETQRGLTLH